MITLLIIADDFTGALDTAVQFAARGVGTCVMTDADCDLEQCGEDAAVLVVNTGSRHMTPAAAYTAVFEIVRRAKRACIPYIYKKTDSALRGNVGSELAAAMDAAGADRLPFVPAFPQMNRVTRAGVHYVDGVPVAESVFGGDPFEPVRFSKVSEILAQQTEKTTFLCASGSEQMRQPGIYVYDAENCDDLACVARCLGTERLHLAAGCAGFASALADVMGVCGCQCRNRSVPAPLMVFCGSMNPVTVRQLDRAERAGFPRIRLTPAQKLDMSWLDTPEGERELARWQELTARKRLCIVDVNGAESEETDRASWQMGIPEHDIRDHIASNLGKLIRRLLDSGLEATLMCSGGDTLLALFRSLNVTKLTPVCELETGVVLARFAYGGRQYHIISKSGGFGGEDLLCRLAASGAVGEEGEAL